MPDNITAPATGAVLATDDVGGIHYPKTKLAFGPSDSASDVRDDQPLPMRPRVTGAGNLSVQTAAVGSDWAVFGNQACHELTIVNNTGVAIEVRQGAAGATLPIPDKAAFPFAGISNANQLGVRRVDQINTQVTVAARWSA